MPTANEFIELQEELETAKEKSNMAKAQVSVLLKKLKDEFGCNNIEEAEALLKKLNSRAKKLEEQFQKDYQEFKEKWDDRLQS